MPTTWRVVTAMFSLAVFALCASAPAAPQTKQLPVVKIGTTGSLDLSRCNLPSNKASMRRRESTQSWLRLSRQA